MAPPPMPETTAPKIKHLQRIGIGIDDPAGADQDAAEADHELRPALRAEHVDDPALDRREPGSSAMKIAKANWIARWSSHAPC